MESPGPDTDAAKTPIPATTLQTSSPLVSLVIPTHNRLVSLRTVLESLARQTIPSAQFEVLVICDGCTDETVAGCQALKEPYSLRIIEQVPNQGPAAARNRGVTEAASPLILFIDDDVVPEPTLIAEHLRLHTEDECAVVIGPLLAPPDVRLNPWTRWEAAMLDQQYQGLSAGTWKPTPRQFYTGNASVRREHILAAGGFDATFRRAEDVELAYRFRDQGLHFYFNPQAKGWHYALRSLQAWLNISSAYGEADVLMYRNGRILTLKNMAKEFYWRARPLQWLARACVGRPLLLQLTVATLLTSARLTGWLHLPLIDRAAYSAIFNLRYWQSISEHLGGKGAFWELVHQYRPAAVS